MSLARCWIKLWKIWRQWASTWTWIHHKFLHHKRSHRQDYKHPMDWPYPSLTRDQTTNDVDACWQLSRRNPLLATLTTGCNQHHNFSTLLGGYFATFGLPLQRYWNILTVSYRRLLIAQLKSGLAQISFGANCLKSSLVFSLVRWCVMPVSVEQKVLEPKSNSKNTIQKFQAAKLTKTMTSMIQATPCA